MKTDTQLANEILPANFNNKWWSQAERKISKSNSHICRNGLAKTVLENGIRVVTESIPDALSISLGVMIDASPRNETMEQCGLAHLCEHLMFQGTINRSAMEIARLMDGTGGYIGGLTTRDYTYYKANLLADYTPHALDLLGDILLNPIFPQESLVREKEAILCEIDGSRDIPDQYVHSLLRAHIWPDHSLGRPIAGNHHTIRNFSREDVIYFVHQNYLPDRMIIAAAGKVDHADFVAQVRDSFWRIIGNGSLPATESPDFRSGIVLEDAPFSQAYFSVGLRAHPYNHVDRYGLHILDKLLGGGISSRLFRRIREDWGLVYFIGSEYLAYRDDGLLVIEGATAPENIQTVLSLTLHELKDLFSWQYPVDEEELLTVKRQLRSQHLIAGESTDTRMSRLATQEFYFDQQINTEEIMDQIATADMQMLRRLGQELLENSFPQATITVVGPDIKRHCDGWELVKLLTMY
jgi:predicted Zn-dependent peptidase